MRYYWPILLTVGSCVISQICAKSIPAKLSAFASLSLTYLIGAMVSGILYYGSVKNANILSECKNLNWTSFLMGIAVVGMETGTIYMYKVGWKVNTGYIVQSILLAILLIVVGLVLYNEPLTFTKVLGIVICLIGMYFINQ